MIVFLDHVIKIFQPISTVQRPRGLLYLYFLRNTFTIACTRAGKLMSYTNFANAFENLNHSGPKMLKHLFLLYTSLLSFCKSYLHDHK